MIGQHHGIDLYGIDEVCVVADHSGELHLSDLVQLVWKNRISVTLNPIVHAIVSILTDRRVLEFAASVRDWKGSFLTESEGRWLVRQLVPKSVASTGIAELRGDYTGEGWPEHATRKWPLRHAAGPQIDVSWMPKSNRDSHRYFRECYIQHAETIIANVFRI